MKISSALLTAGLLLAVNIISTDSVAQSRTRSTTRTVDRSQGLTDPRQDNANGAVTSTSADSVEDPGGNPDVPVDGGVVFLLAAGAAYGAKKVRDRKKTSAATV